MILDIRAELSCSFGSPELAECQLPFAIFFHVHIFPPCSGSHSLLGTGNKNDLPSTKIKDRKQKEVKRGLRIEGWRETERDGIRGLTLKVMNFFSPSSNTVARTCFPSSRHAIPTYNETLRISRRTPSARITRGSGQQAARKESLREWTICDPSCQKDVTWGQWDKRTKGLQKSESMQDRRVRLE